MVKTIQKKKSYRELTIGVTGVLKKFTKTTGKQLSLSLFLIKLQGYNNFFTGDCFDNLLEFRAVKKSSENIHISLKTPGHLKINKYLKTEYKVIYLEITETATGGVLRKNCF